MDLYDTNAKSERERSGYGKMPLVIERGAWVVTNWLRENVWESGNAKHLDGRLDYGRGYQVRGV